MCVAFVAASGTERPLSFFKIANTDEGGKKVDKTIDLTSRSTKTINTN